PSILFLTIVGTYAIRFNLFDVFLLIGFGLLAYIMKNAGFNPAPIVLGLILGPIAENGLTQSMLMGEASGNVFLLFLTRPISFVLIVLCILSLLSPMIGKLIKKKREFNQNDKKIDSQMKKEG